MWARICEMLLGLWLIFSHYLFATAISADLGSAILILLFAALSFIEKFNKMHLFQIFPSGWLLYIGYTYPTHLLPFGFQNLILTALALLMFAIIPSHASDHPRPWKEFLRKEKL